MSSNTCAHCNISHPRGKSDCPNFLKPVGRHIGGNLPLCPACVRLKASSASTPAPNNNSRRRTNQTGSNNVTITGQPINIIITVQANAGLNHVDLTADHPRIREAYSRHGRITASRASVVIASVSSSTTVNSSGSIWARFSGTSVVVADLDRLIESGSASALRVGQSDELVEDFGETFDRPSRDFRSTTRAPPVPGLRLHYASEANVVVRLSVRLDVRRSLPVDPSAVIPVGSFVPVPATTGSHVLTPIPENPRFVTVRLPAGARMRIEADRLQTTATSATAVPGSNFIDLSLTIGGQTVPVLESTHPGSTGLAAIIHASGTARATSIVVFLGPR